MDGRRNKGTAKHAGVVLKRRALPSGAVSWRARFVDPDSKTTKYETLPDALTTDAQRSAWAVNKVRALKDRVTELATGDPFKTRLTLVETIERYFTDEGPGLKPKTLIACRSAAAAMLEWAGKRGVRLADNLTTHHLAELRTFLKNRPSQHKRSGGKRGGFAPSDRRRAPASVNRDLGAIRTILEHLRKKGLVPMLSTWEKIADGLELLPLPKPTPEYLRPAELVRLLEAAGRHDSDTFAMTREEKAEGKKGGTPRHEPILPYPVTVLLSGMRADEARMLKWSAVDLTAPPAGVITLRPEDTKTKHGRIVDLLVSPFLSQMLAAMKLRAGDDVYVFGDRWNEKTKTTEPRLTHGLVESARKRLMKTNEHGYGAPSFTWQQLRITAGTFLANSSIFGGASVYREARQLGHSVAIAERHYLGVVHVDPAAKTLECAMGIESAIRKVFGVPNSVRSDRLMS